jgi:hypothetical protein
LETINVRNIIDLESPLNDLQINLPSRVTIVADGEQLFRGACGLDLPGTPRNMAFCTHAILRDDVMVVPDARNDLRFADA